MPKIAIQLYSLREQCAADLDGALEKIAAAGYDGVETFSYLFGLSAAELKVKFDKYGLACPSMHVGYDDFQADIGKVIENAVTLGAKFVIIPYSEFNCESCALNLVDFVEDNADKINASGLKWLYHNHAHEHKVLASGKDFYNILLENTNETQINLQVDTYWVEQGGARIADFIERVKPRIGGFHLKDHREIGAGSIDFPLVLKTAKELSHEWLVVEQEAFDTDPFESIKISINYIR